MLAIYCRTSYEKSGREESPIEQQKAEGIKFAVENGFGYEIYEDKGVSGYLTSDDDRDPYANRPQFSKLIADIKEKRIDSVWIWEHSRLSRNVWTSVFLFREFEKHKVILYERDKKIDYDDPDAKFMRHIMDSLAERERDYIVARTSRGFRNAIDNGKRQYAELFGYKADGRTIKGYKKFIPVDVELNFIRIAYDHYFAGDSMRSIAIKFFNNLEVYKKETKTKRSARLVRILCHYEYTGKVLKTSGLAILHAFERGEIDNLSELNNEEYWVVHQFYNKEIVTIQEWIKLRELLQEPKRRHALSKRMSKETLGTGILKCPVCGQFYYHNHAQYRTKNGELKFSDHYRHIDGLIPCHNKKNIVQHKLDNLLKIFYFYYSLFFDTTSEVLDDTLKQFDLDIQARQEQIDSAKNDKLKLSKQIAKFNSALDDADVEEIRILAKQINSKEIEQKSLEQKILVLEAEIEGIKSKYNNIKVKRDEYMLRDNIINFFDILDDPRKRDILSKYNLYLWHEYLVVRAKRTIFICSTKENITFPHDTYEKIKNDEEFYKYIATKNWFNGSTTFSFDGFYGANINSKDRPKLMNDTMRVLYDNFLKERGMYLDLSNADYILLVSNDTKLVQSFLSAANDFFDSMPKVTVDGKPYEENISLEEIAV